MDYSKMSPFEIAKDIVSLAEHTDVDNQPVPRSPWGAATALGALPVARALFEFCTNRDARRTEYLKENHELQTKVADLERRIAQHELVSEIIEISSDQSNGKGESDASS